MKKRFPTKVSALFVAFLLVFLPPLSTNHAFAAPQDPSALPADFLNGPVTAVSPAGDSSSVCDDCFAAVCDDCSAVEESNSEDLPFAEAASDFLAGDSPIFLESNDPFYSSSGSWGQSYDDLYWLKRVNADDAWAYSRGTDVPVAVIDTGLDYNHPDIAANLWTNPAEAGGLPGVDDDGNGFIDDINGWDYVNDDNDPFDDHGHGTHVAGIIGAVADNLQGIAGIAPESKIIPIKILGADGIGFFSDLINAIRYAVDLGAKVINMSLGGPKSSLSKSLRSSLESAVSYAKNKGVIPVAAAGNNNGSVDNFYPAGIKNVIAVGAIEPVTDNRAWFSNFGKQLDFVAPGVDVLSTVPIGSTLGSPSGTPDYRRLSGTSMASPVVAGIVALLFAKDPGLTYDNVLKRLRASTVDLGKSGFDNYYGYGLVDALKAVTYGSASSGSTSASGSTSSGSSHSSKDRQHAGASFMNPAGMEFSSSAPPTWFVPLSSAIDSKSVTSSHLRSTRYKKSRLPRSRPL